MGLREMKEGNMQTQTARLLAYCTRVYAFTENPLLKIVDGRVRGGGLSVYDLDR